jgi:hypothetical protein
VIALEQVRAMEVPPQFDPTEEPEPLLGGSLLVHPHDRLDLRVVRRDARAHEPERRRQAIEQVQLQRPFRVEQVSGRVEAGRPGADDRHTELFGVGGHGRLLFEAGRC